MFKVILSLFFVTNFSANSSEFSLRSDVLFSLPAPPQSDLTKVMWWNIACSSTKFLYTQEEKSNFSPEKAWENLEHLLESEFEPDVLILGEYCPSDFDPDTYEKIATHYPHIHRVVRSNPNFRKRNGLRVFSKHPIQVDNETLLTDANFSSNFLTNICESEVSTLDQDWTRHLSVLSIKSPKGDFNLLPIHLANPWRAIRSCKGLKFTIKEILNGVTNVNYHQASELNAHTRSNSPALIIGDFNALKQPFNFFNSKTYNLLQEHFGSSLITTSSPTFIDRKGAFPNSSIDHAFGSALESKYGEVLPLSGSDHLPILIGF